MPVICILTINQLGDHEHWPLSLCQQKYWYDERVSKRVHSNSNRCFPGQLEKLRFHLTTDTRIGNNHGWNWWLCYQDKIKYYLGYVDPIDIRLYDTDSQYSGISIRLIGYNKNTDWKVLHTVHFVQTRLWNWHFSGAVSMFRPKHHPKKWIKAS